MKKSSKREIGKKLKQLSEKPAVGTPLSDAELEKTSGGWSDYGWGGYDSYSYNGGFNNIGGGWMTCGDYNM
jgi:hypothetical protein